MIWTLVITTGVTLLVSLVMPPNYTAETTLVVNSKSVDPVSGMVVPSMLLVPSYLPTQVNIISSHSVALKVVDKLNLASVPSVKEDFIKDTDGKGTIRDWLADLLLKHLDVTPSKESSVISIDFDSHDPGFAAAVANAFAQAYIETNLDLKNEPVRQNAAFFDDQIKVLRARLEKAQAKLAVYRRGDTHNAGGPVPQYPHAVGGGGMGGCSANHTNTHHAAR